MKSLRDYLDILTQLDERVTPGQDPNVNRLTGKPNAPAAPVDTTDPTNPANAVNAPAPAAPAPQGSIATDTTDPLAANNQPKPAAPAAPAAPTAPTAPAAPAGTANPYPPGSPSAVRFDKLSEKDKAWLTKGGGKPDIGSDPTDIILQRAPDKGKAPAAAPAAPATPAAPAGGDKAPGAELSAAAGGDAAKNPNGSNAATAIPSGPQTVASNAGDKAKDPAQNGDAATAIPGGPESAAGGPAAAPAGPANRDAMPFGKAFADAKAKGEKTFMWKGKSYAVQMAAPKQGAKPAAPAPGFSTGIAPKVALPGASQTQNDALSMMAAGNMGAESINRDNSNILETTGYDEVQRLVSLIHYK
jgi:hypothetical protein